MDDKKQKYEMRKQITKKVLATFALEGIYPDAATRAELDEFDRSDLTPQERLAQFYDECNKKYGTNNVPPKD